MATVNYITPITNRTKVDVDYARANQADLVNKNKGAWNYTDLNRICNNLKYASEWMYEQGFLGQPYTMQIKLDWKETDIITYEQLNTMIVDNMNNLKSYSRPDLEWYPIASIANMDYSLANWLERNIHQLSTQVPLPPDEFELKVTKGSGSGVYKARTIVTIIADPPEQDMIFDYWSGDHLENIGSPTASITTYTIPYENVSLQANYTSTVAHTLKVITHTSTTEIKLLMGRIQAIEADPAPQGKVFHHWEVNPSEYEGNLYEPAATTTFTMPAEDVTLTAVYITKGQKQLTVENGTGSGWYEYGTYVAVSSNKPSNGTFTSWTGDTQYLTGPVTQEYNSVKIPDASVKIRANWTVPPTPPRPLVENVPLTVVNGVIASTGLTTGTFTEGDNVEIIANTPEEGYTFIGWAENNVYISGKYSLKATVTIKQQEATVTAGYRLLEYYNLTVITHSGTTTQTKECQQYFSVNGNPPPEGYTFDKWTGDVVGLDIDDVDPPSIRMGYTDRTITATYREITSHKLTVKLASGDLNYEQDEFTTVSLVADPAPDGYRFGYWSKSGFGSISPNNSANATFTFGNGDAVVTPVYTKIWTVNVIGGTINGGTTITADQGGSYKLQCNSLAVDDHFEGWTVEGPGSITNIAATTTYFTVGEGDATITAHISKHPDKTLTIYEEDPSTKVTRLVSQETYSYGTRITIEAPVAPDKTTFLTWLGDVEALSPSALASTVSINGITTDITITATYFFPDAPEYYTLTVLNGYPETGSYASGSQIAIRPKEPAQDWEFHKWMGDTSYLVNPDTSVAENAIIMPAQAITLQARYKVIGELPLYRVSVTGGIASATYQDADNNVQKVSGITIDVPAETQVKLTADPDTVGFVFDYWSGNFETAGVTDIAVKEKRTVFTMPETDVNVKMNRRETKKATVNVTNADQVGTVYPGTYDLIGNLQDTDDKHYSFEYWTCVDAEGTDRTDVIGDITNVETTITVEEGDTFWVEAVYTTSYKLTVVNGQDTGDGYYSQYEVVNTIRANSPPDSRSQFDHWDDPIGIIINIYDPTPIVTMKDSVATITAVYVSIDAKGNSVVMTGDELHTGIITRSNSDLISGVYALGTLVLDKDGCIGIVTNTNPDENDDTDDYKVEKLYYGGNSNG